MYTVDDFMNEVKAIADKARRGVITLGNARQECQMAASKLLNTVKSPGPNTLREARNAGQLASVEEIVPWGMGLADSVANGL